MTLIPRNRNYTCKVMSYNYLKYIREYYLLNY